MSENKSLKDIIKFRMNKINALKEAGIEVYPYKYNYTHKNLDILDNKNKILGKPVNIAGRIISLRKMGKSIFLHIQDDSGKIQIYLNSNNILKNKSLIISDNLDLGDIIGCEGEVFLTKTNELTVRGCNLTMLAKNIKPLPNLKEKDGEAFNAFTDKELRYRFRHLDLIANPSRKEIFKKRSKIIDCIRTFLNENKFIEVETPVLQPLYGGATARPFKTFHNSLNQDLFLRIADELYLKRLIVGGFEKVFEIAKNFRNEGVDKNHNPEFTMCEFYEAYSDIYDMIDRTENLFKYISNKMNIKSVLFNSCQINLDKKFKSVSFINELNNALGVEFLKLNKKDLIKAGNKKNINLENNLNYGKIIDKLFGELIEPKLIDPTFVLDYPKCISPLAKVKRNGSEEVAERFELFIGGVEFANSFSELNDPVEQRSRLETIINSTNKIDKEIQVIDEDFISAMEAGMPPLGGVGIGVDRLVMLFTEQNSIKDVILFPVLRT